MLQTATIRLGASRTDVAALGTALACVAILAIDVALLNSRPDRTWHKGRALAESVRSLTWQYAVCGAPFDHTRSDADARLLERIRLLHRNVPDIAVRPTTATTITNRMRELRSTPFTERRQFYLEKRIHEQQRWYATKSLWHQRRGTRLHTLALILEIGGVSAALAKAFNAIDFDLAGIVAAAIAAIAAWTSARQDTRTATAYAASSNELAIIADTLQNADENSWASAISTAEEAINREHGLWRATHAE